MRDLQSVSKIIDTLLKEPTRFASSRDAVVNVLINKGIEKSVVSSSMTPSFISFNFALVSFTTLSSSICKKFPYIFLISF